MTKPTALGNPAVVYCARCVANGKCYIGVTSRGLKRRVSEHRLQAKKRRGNGHFHKAIRKHGIDGFVFFVLEECETLADALRREIELIASIKPEYNNTLGGEGVLGYKPSIEERRRMSERNKGKAWAKGHKMSAELRARLLAINLGAKRPNSRAPDNSKQVICLDDGKIFKSGAEAARSYGCHATQVLDVCKKKRGRRFAAGRIFRFFTGQEIDESTAAKERAAIPKQGSWSYRKVMCVEDSKVFSSISACAQYYGIASSSLAGVCKGRRKRAHQKRFVYYIGPDTEMAA